MKIRSITYFFNPGWPLKEEALEKARDFITAARSQFEAGGYQVETARLATPPFPAWLPDLRADDLLAAAQTLENRMPDLGFNYISLGPALPDLPESYALIPEALRQTQDVFFSGVMTRPGGGVSLAAVQACARLIHQAAPITEDGFANLRFAALANVPPEAPFFPAAYAGERSPAFALATEAAGLAVQAFSEAGSLGEARQRLTDAIQMHGQALSEIAGNLTGELGLPFAGIDFSLAPFPEEALSLGTALERLGVPAVGLHGSLAAAALLADTLDRAEFPHTGFSGLMLPVLEDAVLAKRAAQGLLTVKDVLLYSAVCGTGLDTIPLAGDTSEGQLAAILLDLAALAQRLDKPLTARLMPIPGKAPGDPTGFDFAYFANSRVMALQAEPLEPPFSGGETFTLQPRRASSSTGRQ
jgi:uncharacterized protein (UPF0210 family)